MLKPPSTGVRPLEAIDGDLTLTPELLKALRAFLSMIDVGVGIQEIFDVEDALSKQEVCAAQITYLKSHPEIAQIFEERYLGPAPNLEELFKLPEDSLGFTYASNLRAVNYESGFFPKVEVKDDASYYVMRMRQTHDIWHTVSGYGLTDFGGLGLAGFQVANNRDPLAVILIAGAILNLIKTNSDYLNAIILVFQQGYEAGSQAKPFLGQKWEEAWEKPIADWRAELNVPPLKCGNMEEAVRAVSSLTYAQNFEKLSA